ncbi:M12 family metallo-peptidase [Herbaspirillum sp. SJZ107]|uniref:M12 family metallo-peptidase n=1 Tax=Herbaspirillum sp. SJZ107 TaxID=2572881 RepID=UPI00116783BF|nr:M12 family metallo-peptidase [Herbaspirillum sp. SJZ107]TQK03284.1 metallopeptidase family M12-like protein [Herbaspirillum sp. SJZ107]
MKTKCSTLQRTRPQATRRIPSMSSLAVCVALAFTVAAPAAQAQTKPAAKAVLGQRAAPFWQSLSAGTSAARTTSAKAPALQLSRFHATTLDLPGMQSLTASAPREQSRAVASSLTISLPAPDGSFQRFVLEESPIMEEGLAAKHPEIKTYRGKGLDDPNATLRMDITPLGLHASVRSPNGGWYVDPYYKNDTSVYAAYSRADLVNPRAPLVEGHLDESQLTLSRSLYNQGDSVQVSGSGFKPGASVELAVRAEGDEVPLQTLSAVADKSGNISVTLPAGVRSGAFSVSASNGTAAEASFLVVDADVSARAVGDQLRTYRLALVTDPSYATYVGANNVTAAKVTLINRVTQIYEEETSIRLVLIDATDNLNLDTAAEMTGANGPCGGSACYTTSQASTCSSSLLSRNRVVAGLLAGASNFDIGHIGLGLNGGGIASLGVVGRDAKAQGCTGIPTPVGDFYAVDYVAHEMGHQFSGNHTFNGTQVNCSGGNRSAANSVEPGSGSSIMAYAGICGTDDLQPHSDPYWSQRSFDEITTYTSGAENLLSEIQMGVLTNFTTNGQQFQLSFNGGVSAPIVRGSNYTTTGIAAAIQAIPGWPAGATATVSSVTDTAFTVTFGGTLANTNIASLQLVNPTAGVTGYVGEITAGGPTTRNGSVSATTNRAPAVTVPDGYTIPVRTPFALTGSATDPDGDAVTYMWEQNDRGAATGTGLVSNTKTNGPLFRQFGTRAVVTSTGTLQYDSPGENHVDGNPTRVFPDMAQILINNTNAETGACPTASTTPTAAQIDCFSEFLPTAAYVGFAGVNASPASLHFKLTARDGRGGVNSATTTLTLAPAAGPFLVNSFNGSGVTVDGGSTQTITWSVANTNVAPVSVDNVKISLSTDGGLTFPTVLAASVPNNGSASVTLPAVVTSSARIKVEAVGNVFFDVSNANFAIQQAAPQPVAGDVDGDGAVSCTDYGIVKASLGKRPGQPGYDARADVNKDGAIDARDLQYVTLRLPQGLSCK